MRKVIPFPRRPAPELALIRQATPLNAIAAVRKHTWERVRSALAGKIRPGDSIAITAGSRGMGNMTEILAGICDAVKESGGNPFIIPAMGSHGGAVPEGQAEILRKLGVTEGSVGAPIRATMDTVELGVAENGAKVHLDKFAFEADGIIVLARVATHPEASEQARLASGLLKMSTIGLGKQSGAFEAHSHGLWDSVRSVPKVLLERAKIMLGVAVVETASRKPVAIEAVPPTYAAWVDSDARLLQLSREHFLKIPFKQLDVLILDELGKNICGSGMDLNVVGSWRVSCGAKTPDYHRIVVLSLTPESLGNGIGIGLADFTTQRFVRAFDPGTTYVNVLTATERGSNPREASVPLALESDREAIEVAMLSSLAGPRPRVCRAKSTASLEELWVSPALLDEVAQNPRLTVLQPPAPLPYDSAGNLLP